MKKLLIGSLVGGIIIFIYQTLSWTVLNLHAANQQYTPKQDTILAFMNQQFTDDGSYEIPFYPPGTNSEEMGKIMTANAGKPWMQIQYHKSLNVNMGANIMKGLITDILLVALLCWILLRNSPFTIHIWYPKADIGAHFMDAVVSWSLCGLWLGWWLKPKKVKQL